jgi:hypothetical protein
MKLFTDILFLKVRFWLYFIGLFTLSINLSAKVVTYPASKAILINPVFTMKVNGKKVRVQKLGSTALTDSVTISNCLMGGWMCNDGVTLGFELNGDNIHAACGLHSMSDVVMAHCWNRTPDIFAVPVGHGTWHTVRIEVNLETNTINFFMDGKQLTVDHYDQSFEGAAEKG